MLTGNEIQSTLLFPVRDGEARKKFLIACLMTLAGYIVPLVPFMLLYGYVARIMRQVFEKRALAMPEWDDWNGMLADGARIFSFFFVVTMPIILMMVVSYIIFFFSIFALDNPQDEIAALGIIGMVIAGGLFLLVMLIAIPVGIFSTPAMCHIVEKRSFSAGFRIGEWWPILRKNLAGFLITYILVIAISYAIMFVMQILMLTIIFICVLPFFMMAYTAYFLMVQQILFARAYVEGRDKLAAA